MQPGGSAPPHLPRVRSPPCVAAACSRALCLKAWFGQHRQGVRGWPSSVWYPVFSGLGGPAVAVRGGFRPPWALRSPSEPRWVGFLPPWVGVRAAWRRRLCASGWSSALGAPPPSRPVGAGGVVGLGAPRPRVWGRGGEGGGRGTFVSPASLPPPPRCFPPGDIRLDIILITFGLDHGHLSQNPGMCRVDMFRSPRDHHRC
jgi:hypothetical protein